MAPSGPDMETGTGNMTLAVVCWQSASRMATAASRELGWGGATVGPRKGYFHMLCMSSAGRPSGPAQMSGPVAHPTTGQVDRRTQTEAAAPAQLGFKVGVEALPGLQVNGNRILRAQCACADRTVRGICVVLACLVACAMATRCIVWTE